MNSERFLQDIIAALSTSPDFRTTIDSLARLGTEDLADWCAIYMFENEQMVRRLAVAPVPQIEALFPLDVHAKSGPGYVRRSGEYQLLTNPGPDVTWNLGIKLEELALHDVLKPGLKPLVYACLPAVARSRPVGAVVFLSANPERHFDATTLALATNLANAAAVAMDSSKLYRDAQEANRLKDEFVAMVSHELRTPLTPILGCIHLLRSSTLSPANFERALEMIERNANTQVQIVEDLLDASRIVAGKLHLRMKSTAVVPVIDAAIQTVKTSAEAKGITIATNFADTQATIDGDPHRLQQIIWNLLSNAVKFTPTDGSIEVDVRFEGNQVQIQVTDTGIGIPADFLPYIFDRFSQGSEASAKMQSGLGLGLAIVRHLVELHKGSIQATSAGPGKGAVFTMRFPSLARQAAAAGGQGGGPLVPHQ